MIKIIKNKMNENHKRKIGEANKIALKKFYEKNPIFRNNGMFKKGVVPWNKGGEIKQIQGENHLNWKGGISRGYINKILKKYGKKKDKCQLCGSKERIHIHHIDGNPKNNFIGNLGIVCSYCHAAIHENGKQTRFKSKREELI